MDRLHFLKKSISGIAIVPSGLSTYLEKPCLSACDTGNVYYVSTKGNNGNPGTPDRPWATLHKACELARAGDIVLIRGGVYSITESIRPRHSGTSEAPIIYKAYPGEQVVIDALGFTHLEGNGRENFMHFGSFHIEGVSHIRIEHLNIRNSRNVGFMIRGPKTSSIELYHCTSGGSYGSGIGLWYARQIVVEGCEISGANDQSMRPEWKEKGKEAPHEALTIAGAEHFEVRYNCIHDCHKEGIDCKEVSKHGTVHHNHIYNMPRQGLYADSWFGLLKDVVFYSNRVHDCEWGIAISSEGEEARLEEVRIHHNLLYNNRGSGVFFSVWNSDGPRRHVYVYHNTIYRNGSPRHWAGAVGGIDIRSRNLRDSYIFNNICSDNFDFEIATFDQNPAAPDSLLEQKNIRILYNLSKSFKNTIRDSSYGKVYGTLGRHAVTSAPKFVNPAEENFHLLPASPAIGTGMPDAPVPAQEDLGAFLYLGK